VEHFEAAPPVVNLIDPDLGTRKALIDKMRQDGWVARTIWVPIPLLAAAMIAARWTISAISGQRADRMAVWQILRPRRFDVSLSARIVERMRNSESAQLHFTAGRIAAAGPANLAASDGTAA
jgi:hypothetical protein